MIHLRLILLGVTLIGSVGLAIYSAYRNNQQQQHYQEHYQESSYNSVLPSSNPQWKILTSRRKRRQHLQAAEDNNPTWSSHSGETDDIANSSTAISSPLKRELDTSEEINTTCSICLVNTDLACSALCCNHRFHMKCIMSWLNEGKTTCPICRATVV